MSLASCFQMTDIGYMFWWSPCFFVLLHPKMKERKRMSCFLRESHDYYLYYSSLLCRADAAEPVDGKEG